jgi:anthranilate synthase component 2
MVRQSGLCEFEVVKNDAVPVSCANDSDGMLISPGPGTPAGAGITCGLIKEFASTKSILGICLGFQAIAEVFGGTLYNLEEVRHGVSVNIEVIEDDILFKGIDKNFKAGLYHSWAVDPRHLPDSFDVTAVSDEGVIMAIKHKVYNVRGVQFHPESVMTFQGEKIIRNWLTGLGFNPNNSKF